MGTSSYNHKGRTHFDDHTYLTVQYPNVIIREDTDVNTYYKYNVGQKVCFKHRINLSIPMNIALFFSAFGSICAGLFTIFLMVWGIGSWYENLKD